jgi:hypothetical protein
MLIAGCAVAVVIWPWLLPRNHGSLWIGIIAAVAMASAVFLVRPRHVPALASGAVGTALLLCIQLFHGSSCWWDCGFHFGTIHWQWMIMGETSNLPGLLAFRFGWPFDATQTAFTLPAIAWHWPSFLTTRGWWPAVPLNVTSKQLCSSLYIAAMTACGIGVGLHARRRDSRILVALTAPWLMFFCFPAQIHERYLLFASGISAICIGDGVGIALLGFVLTIVTSVMTLHTMLDHCDLNRYGVFLNFRYPWLFSKDSGNVIYKYLGGTQPDIAWAVLVCAAIFLYYSVVPSRQRKSVGI